MNEEFDEMPEYDSLILVAANTVIEFEQGTASLLQRKLQIGYNRACRIIDQLEELGIVGEFSDSPVKASKFFNSENELLNYKNEKADLDRQQKEKEKEEKRRIAQLQYQKKFHSEFKDLLRCGEISLTSIELRRYVTVLPLGETERVERAIEIWNNEVVNDGNWIDDDMYSKKALEEILDSAINKRDSIINLKRQQYLEEQREKSIIFNWQCPDCGTIVRQNEQPRCQKCNTYFKQL